MIRRRGWFFFGFWDGKNKRYNHPDDVVGMFNMEAKNVLVPSLNPLTLHSYKGYTYNFDKHHI